MQASTSRNFLASLKHEEPTNEPTKGNWTNKCQIDANRHHEDHQRNRKMNIRFVLIQCLLLCVPSVLCQCINCDVTKDKLELKLGGGHYFGDYYVITSGKNLTAEIKAPKSDSNKFFWIVSTSDGSPVVHKFSDYHGKNYTYRKY